MNNPHKLRVLPQSRAAGMGYSHDKRKRRRQHRRAARELAGMGATATSVATWHRFQARYFGR